MLECTNLSLDKIAIILLLPQPGLYWYHLPLFAIMISWYTKLASRMVFYPFPRHGRYSTCTLNKWENEGICKQLLRSVEDCERISLDDVLGAPSVDSSGRHWQL